MTSSAPAFVAVPARAEHATGLSALFERASVACYCRYWHFEGNTNAWLDRVANHPESNRAELLEAFEAGSPEARGIVALTGEAGERIVGWLKLASTPTVPKIYAQRVYRSLKVFDGPRDDVLTIGCLLVDPDFRRRGVAEALVIEAVAEARRLGARAIEALPRRAESVRDEEAFMGPHSLYERLGFAVVHDFAPYPVMRLSLRE